MRYKFPKAKPGQAIGLLGGSFDPPHLGHVKITKTALTRFDLDAIWWIVSPGNPLKPRAPANLEQRLLAARHLMSHPKVTVTDIEAQLGTRYTVETLTMLRKLYPRTRFVWLMGADNLAQISQWTAWEDIFETVPIGVLARPGHRLAARHSVAARRYHGARIAEAQARLLPAQKAPAWCFLNLPMSPLSSSNIRAATRCIP